MQDSELLRSSFARSQADTATLERALSEKDAQLARLRSELEDARARALLHQQSQLQVLLTLLESKTHCIVGIWMLRPSFS
jgi:hypothetical protein